MRMGHTAGPLTIEETRTILNSHGFDDEVIRLAEVGHRYWREHKFEGQPRLQKIHLESTPTFWNMNGSAMDLFLMTARGIQADLLAELDRLRESNEELVKWAGAALKAEFGGLDAANLAPGTHWAHLQVAIRRATSGEAQEGASDV